MEGKIITFERSFASHPKAKYWSKLNTFNPNVVHQGANIVAWFECINCNHHFKKPLYEVKRGGWCPYCSGGKTTKLCEDNDCLYCYNKSFKSVPNSKYLLDDTINTRSITKNNTVKMEFKCNVCRHEFKARPKSVSEGYWCPYCYHSLCDNNDCEYCFNNSFASNPYSKYWSSKNRLTPRNVRKFSKIKAIFICDECKLEFTSDINTVSKGHWCPVCKNKTEKILLKWLNDRYDNIIFQPKYAWCKSLKCSKLLAFDYEYKNIIIELDGDQHFRQVGNWKSFESNIERDKYKMKCALENGKHIIRISQDIVFKNKNNWEFRLKEAIEDLSYKKDPQIKYIDINPNYYN